MGTQLLIIAFLIAIVLSLLAGAIFLVRDPSSRKRTLWALTLRVGLQVALILFLVLAWRLGWIQPHGAIPAAPE